jgi:hypothetical protein
VRLVALRNLPPAAVAQRLALRAEAGRWWTTLVSRRAQARAPGQWLSAGARSPATVK